MLGAIVRVVEARAQILHHVLERFSLKLSHLAFLFETVGKHVAVEQRSGNGTGEKGRAAGYDAEQPQRIAIALDEVFRLSNAAQHTITHHGRHAFLVDCGKHVFLLPLQSLKAQRRIVVLLARPLLNAIDSIVVLGHDRLRRTAVFPRLARRKLFDGRAQHFDRGIGIGGVGLLALLIGQQHRQCEVREQQRHQNHAACEEDEELALREHARRGIERPRQREHDGKRDGALRARKRQGERFFQRIGRDQANRAQHTAHLLGCAAGILLFGLSDLLAADIADAHKPQRAHANHDGGNHQHEEKQLAVAYGLFLPHAHHGVRKLNSQKHEYQAVEHERKHAPYAR